MQDQVKVLAGQVSRDATDAAESVATIAKLDHVKKNMESACSTLKEATELSGLFIKVRCLGSAQGGICMGHASIQRPAAGGLAGHFRTHACEVDNTPTDHNSSNRFLNTCS